MLTQPVAYSVKLPAFEGPLDLLLFLIQKNEIDIYDIPIETVTRQYLQILYEMEQLRLDVAGDFFVMAATLMEIKSRLLLPKHAQTAAGDDEEPFDPRLELIHQLLEYQKFKQAASDLDRMAELQSGLLARRVSASKAIAVERPLKAPDQLDLWHAFNQVLRRLSEKLVVGEIHGELVTTADRMEFILSRVERDPCRALAFSALFAEDEKTPIKVVIATFLGILELVRLKKISIWQDEQFAEIFFGATEEKLETDAPNAESETP